MKKFLHIFFICIVAATALALTGGSGCKCVDCSTNFTRNPNIHDFPANAVVAPGMFTVSPDDKYLYVIDWGQPTHFIADMPQTYGAISRVKISDGTTDLMDTSQSVYSISCSPDGKYLISCSWDSVASYQRDSLTLSYDIMSLYSYDIETTEKRKIPLPDSMTLWGAIALPGDTSVIGPAYDLTKDQWGFYSINLNTGRDSLLCSCGRKFVEFFPAEFFDVSPDGKYIVYLDSNNNAVLHDIATGSDRALGFTASWLRFSPDGTQIAYNSFAPLSPPTITKLYDMASGQNTTLDMNVGAYGQITYYLAWEHSEQDLIYSAAPVIGGDPLGLSSHISLYILQL